MIAVERLLREMERGTALYAAFCAVCEREHEAVKKMDMAALDLLMKEKEALALQLKETSEVRVHLVAEIAAQLKRETAALTLADIAASQGRSLKGTLLAAGEKLKKAAVTAAEQSDFSRKLIARAMDTVLGTIRVAGGLAGGDSATYKNGKTVEGRMRSGLMVTKAY